MGQPLAVIGMACRLPGGIDTAEQFWEVLKSGREVVSEVPHDRWDKRAWFDADPERPGKSYAPKGGFRENLDLFDAGFFGISPREASRMDPQQRLLLEMTWEAMEDAGQVPETLAGSDAAVIFGLSAVDYQNLQLLDPDSVNAYSNSGCSASIAANRVSYYLDLRGPSFVLDTACSSSLTALNTACEAIWSGRSRLAVTGGVNVLLSPFPWVGFSKALMLSRGGRCRVFDAGADGYVRSEGGGVLVIKPLDRAEADGDPIRAVILASATNCDGRTQGMFLPSAAVQKTLLKEVYRQAGMEPARVSYVEAHGTGTAAGDPVECDAIGEVLGSSRIGPLLVGSVKTNLGHLEAASGVAGVMKVILALEHREIPPSLHFERPNPRIPFAEINVKVVSSHTSLAECPRPLVMGVNSFGFGGANAHVVLQEYRPSHRQQGADQPVTLPLFVSAHTPDALRSAALNHAHYLRGRTGGSLYDICYTAAVRRAHHPCRLVVFGNSGQVMSEKLAAFVEGRDAAGVISEKALPGGVRPVFIFSGNGSQWPGMGRTLMRESDVFRRAVERVDDEFKPLAGWSLCREMLAGASRMARTEIAQPMLFAVQAGLVEMLAAHGLEPHAVAGHSVGEVASAWAAGIYSLAQAVRLIHARSQAQVCAMGRGKMAACGLSQEQAAAALARYNGSLDVASINSPRSVTVCGVAEAVAELGVELERRGVFFRALDLDYPFHGRLMDDVRKPLLQKLFGLHPAPARIPFFSTTTGGSMQGGEMDAEYWWRNVRQPVLFGPALESMIRTGYSLFIEIGPHPVLGAYMRQCLEASNAEGRAIETLRRQEPEMPHVLSAIGQSHALGCVLNMSALFPVAGRTVSLPFYPWQRARHWNVDAFGPPRPARGPFQHLLLGYRSSSAEPLWENRIDIADLPYLADHRVLGAVVFPLSAFAEMALKAGQLWKRSTAVDLEDVEVRTPLTLGGNETAHIQFSVCPEDGAFKIRTRGADDAEWGIAAAGRLVTGSARVHRAPVSLDDLRDRLTDRMTAEEFYRKFAARGLPYGPAFRRVEEVWVGTGEALGSLASNAGIDLDQYCFHPAVLDACLQVTGAALDSSARDSTELYVASGIHRLRLFADARNARHCYARLERQSAESAVFELDVLDAEGATLAELEAFRIRRVETAAAKSSSVPLLDLRLELRPGKADRAGPPVSLDRLSFVDAVRARVTGQSRRPANRWVRAVVEEFAGRWPEDHLLRVVEIGGDAGPLAPQILPLLPLERTEYSRSDELNLDERGFDLVLAGAFHTGDEAAGVLARCVELCHAGSLLIFVEQEPQPFYDLLLGSGKPDAGLLSRGEMVRRLQECGLEEVVALGEPLEGRAESNVFLAWTPPKASEAAPTEPVRRRIWMLLRDSTPDPEVGGLLETLGKRLADAGHQVISASSGAPPRDLHCRELIYGWGLTRSMDDLAEITRRRCADALSLVQGLTQAQPTALPRLWLLTCGAIPVIPPAGRLNPSQASLWGLGRVLAHEIPGLATKLVDLHWNRDPAAVIDRLMAEFNEAGEENEIVLTERARYVHRVSRTSLEEQTAKVAPEPDSGFRLTLSKRGSPDNLVLERSQRTTPAAAQVEIRVQAAGLNFHDLLSAMNVLSEEDVSLGLECAGEVVRVGEGVTALRPGDKVVAFGSRCFSSFVLADAGRAFRIPAGISYEAAATLLTVFATVLYALEHLGRIQPGERVLIHGAAGGVGLAAIQYSNFVGAEVFATAGTEEKREYLRRLGVPNVFSSRTTDYAGEILKATGGEGIDLVLNSLSGENVARSFSVLRPFGRFLELGKRDFLEQNRMAMAPFRNNLSYFGIDLQQALALQPAVRDKILPRMLELISSGVLRPLPFRVFPISRAREAFRHMQKSQHIGKIVLSFDDPDVRLPPNESASHVLRPDGTYLITGGLRGLGLETARWMAQQGAKYFLLVGRSGLSNPEAAAAVEELRRAGCIVQAARADVSDREAFRRLLADSTASMPPLRGVVHAAMVVDDAMATAMTAERFWRAASPKILGAWNLHQLTLDAPLDFFVLYSSVSATLGVPGQANYAAGNAFLESLAHYRQSLGLPGTAIAWGAISDVGYLSRNTAMREMLDSRLGVRPLSSTQALEFLGRVLGRNRPRWIAADINWSKLAAASATMARFPRFASLVENGTGTATSMSAEDILARLRTLPPDEARVAVTDILAKELSRVMGGAGVSLDPDRPLAQLGIDSLMAVELLAAVEARFHVQINPLELMGGATIRELARRVAATVATTQTGG